MAPLRSQGAVVRLAKTGLGPGAASALWYLPAVALVFLLGVATERWISAPSERWLRERLTHSPAPAAAQR